MTSLGPFLSPQASRVLELSRTLRHLDTAVVGVRQELREVGALVDALNPLVEAPPGILARARSAIHRLGDLEEQRSSVRRELDDLVSTT